MKGPRTRAEDRRIAAELELLELQARPAPAFGSPAWFAETIREEELLEVIDARRLQAPRRRWRIWLRHELDRRLKLEHKELEHAAEEEAA